MNIFPANVIQPMADATMLQVIVIALVFGFGIMAAGKKAQPVADLVNSMSEVCIKIMHGIICFAPSVFSVLSRPLFASNGPRYFAAAAEADRGCISRHDSSYVVVYSGLVKILANVSPIRFFKEQMSAMVFIRFRFLGWHAAREHGMFQKLGVSTRSRAVLPLGATINMDGTSIYMGVCSIFIAQVFGIDLTLSQQFTIVLTAVLASIGTAGVPGSGMIMLAMVLQSVGLPVRALRSSGRRSHP